HTCPVTTAPSGCTFVVRHIFDLLLHGETEIFHRSCANDRKRDGCPGLVLAHVPEVDTERAKLPVKMCAFHAHSLGKLPDLAVAQKKLLLEISPLELLACLAKRQRQQVLLDERLTLRRLNCQLALDLLEADLFLSALDQQPVHERLELADVVRPGI